MPNTQVGRQMYSKKPPQFANCVVRGGTWTETDATKSEENMNEVEETFNLTAWDRGRNARCEVFADAGFAPSVLDVLAELASADNPNPVTWVIVAPLEKRNFGKRALIFSLNLIQRDALDTTQVS